MGVTFTLFKFVFLVKDNDPNFGWGIALSNLLISIIVIGSMLLFLLSV